MDPLTREEILITAELAGIPLDDPEELRLLSNSLETVLEYFEIISSVPVSEGASGSPVEATQEADDLRLDCRTDDADDRALSSSPDFEEGYFFIPRIGE